MTGKGAQIRAAIAAFVVAIVTFGGTGTAHAAGAGLVVAGDLVRDVPCPGCVLVGKRGPDVEPLVVVLHGDEGSPRKVAPLWAPLAERGVCRSKAGVVGVCAADDTTSERRSFRVLALRCPKSEGCTGSFWRWSGSVDWVLAQVDAVRDRVGVDERRVYVAGWSGGSTYIGMKGAAWFPRIAALSLVGGGAPPETSSCFAGAGGTCAPVHFLLGDANPLFGLADRACDAFSRCGHDVEVEILRGADHSGEWRAYERRAPAIAWWLLDHARGCDAKHPDATSLADPLPSAFTPPATSSSPARTDAPLEPAGAPSTVVSHRAGCACRAAPYQSGAWETSAQAESAWAMLTWAALAVACAGRVLRSKR
ncbi:MAG: hypothetical protein HOW73_06520 [Polyangiaceae bacterium]|nr:hypothetical protein [Polyangiaceae bacterium]